LDPIWRIIFARKGEEGKGAVGGGGGAGGRWRKGRGGERKKYECEIFLRIDFSYIRRCGSDFDKH
jgi:hypothetical protein